MYPALKFFLFQFSAEKAHHITTFVFKVICNIPGVAFLLTSFYRFEDKRLERSVFGLKFKNPVGLAAGFDKDGKHYHSMSKLGFGFVEIGTVTPEPQEGNPQPRLFRLPQDYSLINRMGFNNDGVDAMVSRLKERDNSQILIGANIGKNKWTPNDQAYNDYLICFTKLYEYVDYFVVNVSSPNTPNLRALQEKEPLQQLLSLLVEQRSKYDLSKPILLKISPDLNDSQLDDIIEIVKLTGIDGLIATNTTISRENLKTPIDKVEQIGNGGLSGHAMVDKATAVISYIHTKSKGSIPIIGVGGIASGIDAKAKFDAGACLIQVYSGLIYKGPSLVKQINKYLVRN